MAITFQYDRDRALELLRAFNKGQPIQPRQPEGWDADDLLMIAGIGFLSRRDGSAPGNFGQLHKEHQEAIVDQIHADKLAAIEFVGGLTVKAAMGAYDQEFEPVILARIRLDADGKPLPVEIQGTK